MVAVGNVMGDASKAVLMSNDSPTTNPTTLTEGTVDSSGVLDDPTQIDARSLDLVFSSDTALYMKQAIYDPDASNVMTALNSDPVYTIATYDTTTSGARTVTALEVFDLDGNGFADPVVAFSSSEIYRSIFYIKVDFTMDGTTLFTTLRDTTCDVDPRATGCSLFAGPSDPSDFLGVSDATGNLPTTYGAPEMVLSPDSGGSVSGGAADAVGTIKMEIADFDNDGNPDILYGTDSQEAARVSLARPWNTAKTSQTSALTNENSFGELPSDVVDDLKEIENNMLNMLDAMLLSAPTVTVHADENLDGVGPNGADEDSYGYVNRGDRTQNDNLRTEYNANTQPVVYPDIVGGAQQNTYVTNGANAADRNTEYDAPAGALDLASSSAAAGVSDATCRAPSESVLPMTVSLQVDFPTVRF
jgi:hypothetical protein